MKERSKRGLWVPTDAGVRKHREHVRKTETSQVFVTDLFAEEKVRVLFLNHIIIYDSILKSLLINWTMLLLYTQFLIRPFFR